MTFLIFSRRIRSGAVGGYAVRDWTGGGVLESYVEGCTTCHMWLVGDNRGGAAGRDVRERALSTASRVSLSLCSVTGVRCARLHTLYTRVLVVYVCMYVLCKLLRRAVNK